MVSSARTNIDLQAEIDASNKRIADLNDRLQALGNVIEKRLTGRDFSPTWWRDHAGRFENDTVFDEIVRLGAAHRRKERKVRVKRGSCANS